MFSLTGVGFKISQLLLTFAEICGILYLVNLKGRYEMPYIKRIPQGYSFIANAKSNIFDRTGKCVRENCGLLPSLTSCAVPVGVISILSSTARLEVALSWLEHDASGRPVEHLQTFLVDSPTRFAPLVDSLLSGYMGRNVDYVLNRSGKIDGVRFRQYFLLYNNANADMLRAILFSIKEIGYKELINI